MFQSFYFFPQIWPSSSLFSILLFLRPCHLNKLHWQYINPISASVFSSLWAVPISDCHVLLLLYTQNPQLPLFLKEKMNQRKTKSWLRWNSKVVFKNNITRISVYPCVAKLQCVWTLVHEPHRPVVSWKLWNYSLPLRVWLITKIHHHHHIKNSYWGWLKYIQEVSKITVIINYSWQNKKSWWNCSTETHIDENLNLG